MPACEAYHVPAHVSRHIDYITPGIKLLALESHKSKREAVMEARIIHGFLKHEQEALDISSTNLSTCDEVITPACVAALYHIPPHNSSNPNNSLGIFESELQFYQQEDLNLFFTNFSSNIPNGTHPIPANIDGGQQSTDDPYEDGTEATLDIQLAYPIVYPQKITLYSVDDLVVQANQNDTYTFGFNTFLDALDGVSQAEEAKMSLTSDSLTARSRRITRLATTRISTKHTQIPILVATVDP